MEKTEILEALKKVFDPEYPLSVVELKIVEEKDIFFDGDNIRIEFTPTTPYCPMGGIIGVLIKYALDNKFSRQFDVKVKAGAHVQEDMLNELLSSKEKYDETIQRLKTAGILERCIKN